MRISDWSSDVCSSDLERLQRAQVGDGAARRPSQRGGRGRFATLQQGQRILQREAIARRLDTSRHRVRERCPVLQVGRERQGDELASRSEEHTSELQSLMRISYAVFCLKKKKTNKAEHK